MSVFYEGDKNKPVDLPIGTEQEVHISKEEKKKIRVEPEKRKYSCAGCIFFHDIEGECQQDFEELKDQPDYECTALYRADKKNVVFVEVEDESV